MAVHRVQPPSLWTGTASNVFVDKVPTQRSYTYRPPDPSRFREEIEENTATQVPRAAGEAVRTLGPVRSERTISQKSESLLKACSHLNGPRES